MDVDQMDFSGELEYVGFWARIGAGLIDALLLIAVPLPLLFLLFGRDFGLQAHLAGSTDLLASLALPMLVVLAFWAARQATPGKMVISAVIIDEKTAGPPSIGQHVGRALACVLVAIPFCLGILWIAFDPKKQGWHDKLAGTLVVRARKSARRPAAMHKAHRQVPLN
jgi:uncharacterized RDD family membrane protein YckC